MRELNVNVKSVSGKKSKIRTMKIMYENVNTVGELIKATVKYCVNDYNERKDNSDLLTLLLPESIADKATQGKISFNENHGDNYANLEKAESDAIQAFLDGIVVIFADDKKLENIDEEINIENIDSLTFIKLTMLAGRMW